jgi:hypothetical protein
VTVTGTPRRSPRSPAAPRPTAASGLAYTHTFTASGTSPIAFSLGGGTLPPGLTLTKRRHPVGVAHDAGHVLRNDQRGQRRWIGEPGRHHHRRSVAQTRLEIAGGNHQSAFYNRGASPAMRSPAPLKVRVVDPSGAGIRGQRVEFVSLSPVNSSSPRAGSQRAVGHHR